MTAKWFWLIAAKTWWNVCENESSITNVWVGAEVWNAQILGSWCDDGQCDDALQLLKEFKVGWRKTRQVLALVQVYASRLASIKYHFLRHCIECRSIWNVGLGYIVETSSEFSMRFGLWCIGDAKTRGSYWGKHAMRPLVLMTSSSNQSLLMYMNVLN